MGFTIYKSYESRWVLQFIKITRLDGFCYL